MKYTEDSIREELQRLHVTSLAEEGDIDTLLVEWSDAVKNDPSLGVREKRTRRQEILDLLHAHRAPL